MTAQRKHEKTQILILGGGFAGVETARYLDWTAAKRDGVEVTIISRDNFTRFTPMLDEVASGDLEPAHICNPLRKPGQTEPPDPTTSVLASITLHLQLAMF